MSVISNVVSYVKGVRFRKMMKNIKLGGVRLELISMLVAMSLSISYGHSC